jgi:hypothetical protein
MPNTRKKQTVKETVHPTRDMLLKSIAKMGKSYEDIGSKRAVAVKEASKQFDDKLKILRSNGILQAILAVQLSSTKPHKTAVNAVLAKAFNYGSDERKRLSMAINSDELAEIVRGCKTPAEVLKTLDKQGIPANGLITKHGLNTWLRKYRYKRDPDDNSVELREDEISSETIQNAVKEAHKENNVRGVKPLFARIEELVVSSEVYEPREVQKILKAVSGAMLSIEKTLANKIEKANKKSKK